MNFNVTYLWFLATLIFFVFLARKGWKAVPKWQRYYVFFALAVFSIRGIAVAVSPFVFWLAKLANIPQDSKALLYMVILWGIAYIVTIYWGIIVGIFQTANMLRSKRTA
ncbi:MAG: hypothetical protein ACLQU2_37330 [Candidatus Binataceae bacterium]